MSHYKYTRKRKKNEHLRYVDRQKLEIIIRMNGAGPKYKRRSMYQIAQLLGISPATVSRELKRGRVGPLYGKDLNSTTPTQRKRRKQITTTRPPAKA